jgi:hypothetical protein
MITLDEKKALVRSFLTQCNRYADAKLAEYRLDLQAADGERTLELTHRIGDWTAYRAFNEHAIAELATERLDAWFAETAPADG